MHKKAIIIIAVIAGILIIASGVVGVIVALNRSATPSQADTSTAAADADPSKQEERTTPDLSVDLGACTIIPFSTITKNLKPPVADVRDAENRGFGYEGNGDRSQSCVFAFSADSTTDNRFTIIVTEFKDDTNKNNAVKGLEDYEAVTGIGDHAGFISSQDSEVIKQNTYTLLVITGSKQYTFTLAQPSESDVFTKPTAQTALEAIAESL